MDLPTNLAFNSIDRSFTTDIDFVRIGETIGRWWPGPWSSCSSTAKNRSLYMWEERAARVEVIYSMRRVGA